MLHRFLHFLVAILPTAGFGGGTPLPAQEPAPKAPPRAASHGPLLWRVEAPRRRGEAGSGAATVHWLFGTMHVPDPRVVELDPAVEAAFDEAEVVMTEIDLADAGKAIAALGEWYLPRGRSLRDVLPEATWERLRDYLGTLRLSPIMYQRHRPWTIALELPIIETRRNAMRTLIESAFKGDQDELERLANMKILDLVLQERAEDELKEHVALETYEEQIAALGALSFAEQAEILDGVIAALIDDPDTGVSALERCIRAYERGDADAILELTKTEYAREPGPVRDKHVQAFLYDRNATMVERFRARIEDPEHEGTVFVAVGAAHFPGRHGIVELLREAGYAVTRVGVADSPVQEKR